jgi:hypothetical protein
MALLELGFWDWFGVWSLCFATSPPRKSLQTNEFRRSKKYFKNN